MGAQNCPERDDVQLADLGNPRAQHRSNGLGAILALHMVHGQRNPPFSGDVRDENFE